MAGCNNFSAMAKDRVLIQSPSETTDSYGGRTSSWADVGTYWAWIVPVSGRELFAQQSNQSRATHKMTIRYVSSFKNIKNISDYRVSFDGRYFAVRAIRNLDTDMKSEGKDFQELIVEENAPDA